MLWGEVGEEMSDDLKKRLRLQSEHIPVRTVFDEAADRIEQLERENAEINQPFFNLYAEAFTKIKAVVDRKSTQSIKTIV